MKKLGSTYLLLIIVLCSITITTVLADTVTINTYPYVIQDGSNNPRLAITSSGNVGIGVANPWSNLQVNSVPGAVPALSVTSGGHYFYFNPNLCQGCINPLVQSGDEALIFSNGQSNSGNFVLGSWNAAPAGIRITSSGNVGIDTWNPAQALDVSGNIRLTGNIVSPNDICIGSC